MKKITILLSTILFACCLIFSGCTEKLSLPTSSNIASNGGNVVVIGDYTYFANSYYAYSSLTSGYNEVGKVGVESLYRIKTTNNQISLDEDDKIENLEKVASKVVGYESTQMYVAGDYIYFTSPNIHKTSGSENKFDLVTLFKIKLDGTDLKEILTTANPTPKFNFTQIAGAKYCFIVDGTDLFRLNLSNDTKTVVSQKLTSVVFDKSNEISNAYYTMAREDSNTGNVLGKINLLTGDKTVLSNEIGTTFTLNAYQGGVVYYQKTTTILDNYFYYNDFSNGFNSENELLFATSVTDFTAVEKNVVNGQIIAYIFESQLNIKIFNDSRYTNIVIDSTNDCGAPTEILCTYEDYVYFLTATGIYRVSYKNNIIQKVSDKTSIKADNVDCDGNFLYFFTTIDEGTVYYMHRADLSRVGDNCLTELMAKTK